MAGLLGFDRDAFLNERAPERRQLNAALLEAADKTRRRWMKELAHQLAATVWGEG